MAPNGHGDPIERCPLLSEQRKTSASSFAFLLGMSVSCRHLATVDETADFGFLALRDLPLFASDVPSRRGKLAAGLPDFVAAGRPDSASLATRAQECLPIL